MKHAFVLPGGSAPEQLELAVLAERSGWDGVFVFETAWGVDPWSLLSAMAVRTERVALGTMITPLPWRRPWKLAGQVATLDQLSNGRAVLAVGVGAIDDALPQAAGEQTGLKERAALLDEGIDLVRALLSGERAYHGEHYDFDTAGRTVEPVRERVPIWVIGVWPRPKSMRRALRCDGLIPQWSGDRPGTPDDLREVRAWLAERGSTADLIVEGETPDTNSKPWADAGATWWMETRWSMDSRAHLPALRDRIAQGPM